MNTMKKTLIMYLLLKFVDSELVLMSRKQKNGNYSVSCIAAAKEENSTINWFEGETPADISNLIVKDIGVIPFKETSFKTHLMKRSSFSLELPLVTDERWEDFKLVKLKANEEINVVEEENNKDIRQIQFSVFLNSELLLLIYGYEINTIRFTLNESNTNQTSQVNHRLPVPFNTWVHINLVYKQNQIFLYVNDNSRPINIPYKNRIRQVSLSSMGINNFCKIHKYEVFVSNSTNLSAQAAMVIAESKKQELICISTFIAVYPNSTVTVKFDFIPYTNQTDYKLMTDLTMPEWKKIKMCKENGDKKIKRVQLSITGIFAIDKLRHCTKGYRVSGLENLNEVKNLICSNFQRSQNITVSKVTSQTNIENDCPKNIFGNLCNINCDSYQGDLCNYQRVCTSKQCYCTRSLSGEDCTESCEVGKWGVNCSHNCGFCLKKKCFPKSGKCHNGDICSTGYFGNFCQRNYTVENLETIVLNYTSITLGFNISDSQHIPQDLYCECEDSHKQKKKCSISWNNRNFIITTDNLNVGNNYTVKILKNITKSVSENIISEVFQTKCDGPEESMLMTRYLNGKLSISLNNTTSYNCPLANYYGKVVDKENLFRLIENLDQPVSNLNQCQQYNLTLFTKRNKTLFSKIFNITSLERLENFTISTTSHSAKFSWTPKDKCPSFKNGYKIKYRLLHKFFCNISNHTPEYSMVANETNFEINNLQSLSIYHISIYITTDGGKTLGDIIHNVTFNTTDGEISSEELPTAVTATNTSIVIKQAKCESLNGNITYELIFKTGNITLDVQQNTSVPYEKELKVTIPTGLLPYSKYSVILKIVRNNVTREYKQSQIVFTSLPGEPPKVREVEVYYKNISNIWLRWKPPNPPNGELEHYSITILQLNSTNEKKTFQRKRQPCKFWTGYECYIIGSFPNSVSFGIKIEAKNKNVAKFGEAFFVNMTSNPEKCHSPTNISTEVKNNNNLTVKWFCPPITNGTFQRFYINFSLVHNVEEKIIEEITDPDKHECEVSKELNFSSTYNISINGVNECIGFSNPISVDTFPPEPSFNVFVEESCSNISCIVRIESLKNISENSTLYVTTSSSQRNNCDPYDINKFIEENKNESCKTSLNQTTTDLNIDLQNCTDRICGSNINTVNCSDQFVAVIVVNYYKHRFNNSTICLNITYNNGDTNQNKLSIIIAGATIGAVFFLIVLVIILYIVFFRNKGKDDIFNVAFSKRNGCQIGRPEEVAVCSKNNEIYENTSNLLSMSVQIDEYENYLRNYFGNNKEELRKQFEVIPKMELHSSSVGTLESNKNKNRYKNIKAYEHSRVKLKGLPSDYIHANFIDGYAFPKTYIATQGPKSNTVIDFWHMIMQNNVQYIVMLCNVMENNKKKCMQYWPAENETIVFSEFVVKNIKSNVYTNYVNRKLEITYKDEKRIVQHLHFTKWTDHGTPTYVQTVVPFMKKMTDIPSISYPIVVHCSAGAGRTGTIILSDIVLKMAHNSGSIDFVSTLVKLREQRYGLVDNLDQYIFAHLLVYEYLFGQNFSIPVDISCKSLVNFAVENDVMENILKYVNNMSWQNLTTNNLQITDEMKIKNRFQNIVPGNNILFLSPYPYDDQSSIYINAVSVDCFYSEDKFIVTQQPLPETVGDFWRLAYQYDVNVIINLNEIDENHESSCIFWPDMNEIITPSDVIVSCHAEEDCNLYWSKEITISHIRSKNIKNTIKFFSVKNWKSTDLVCDNLQTLLLLHQHAFSSVTNKIVVTCYDGATASGLFVSLAFVIEKFKLEHNIDVCLAIQTVRKSRNEFVRSKEQVKFLYDSALEYFKTFETYSNFNGLME